MVQPKISADTIINFVVKYNVVWNKTAAQTS